MSMSEPDAHRAAVLELKTLRQKASSGEVDTVLVVFPDAYGRLMGKRLAASYFLESCADEGTHGCDYLLTVNIEMDPLDGFKLASWDQGFGDFAMKPDMSSLRLLPWQKGAAMVICDVFKEESGLVDEAPRSILRKQLDRLEKL